MLLRTCENCLLDVTSDEHIHQHGVSSCFLSHYAHPYAMHLDSDLNSVIVFVLEIFIFSFFFLRAGGNSGIELRDLSVLGELYSPPDLLLESYAIQASFLVLV